MLYFFFFTNYNFKKLTLYVGYNLTLEAYEDDNNVIETATKLNNN